MSQKLPNPQATDPTEVTLVLDSGKSGQRIGRVKTDTNRPDPLAGFTWELSKALLLPNGLEDSIFQLVTLTSAGAFTVSILKAVPNPALEFAVGLVFCAIAAVVMVAARQFPAIAPHASVKVLACLLGGLIALYL